MKTTPFKPRVPATVLLAIIFSVPLVAEKTRRWEQTRFEDFNAGTVQDISIRSDGRLMLAPRFEELSEPTASFLWALAYDSKGNLFAAGGPGAAVFRLGADGRKSTFFESGAIEVHALAVDGDDNVYAATSPDAKVYKIDPSGGYSVFFDPPADYVWGMAFDAQGVLFVASGDEGVIYRVNPSGEGEVHFETGETHVRSIVVDENGDLIVGTDPSGLIMRVSGSGSDEPRGFVLYQSAKKEVTAITIAPDQTIYAAGVGNRTATRTVRPPVTRTSPTTSASGTPAPSGRQPNNQPAAAQRPSLRLPPPAALATRVVGGSEVYRISPDGEPRRVWQSASDIVYALAVDPANKLLVGTGDSGRLIRVESETLYSQVRTVPSDQITALAAGPSGKVVVAASNSAKIYGLGPELAEEGTFESKVFDAKRFTQWGRLEWKASARDASMAVSTRSGNLNSPSRNWSEWSPPITVPEGARGDSPAARFAQWQAVLRRSADGDSPVLDSVTLHYLPKNTPPVVVEIEATAPNYKFPAKPRTTVSKTLVLPPLGRKLPRLVRPNSPPNPGQAMLPAKGRVGVRWLAQDGNGDQLEFKLQIRGEGERNWKLLEEKVSVSHHDWDSTSFADGLYRVRVTASDSPSNPAPEAAAHSKVSEPFAIDNTPPAIGGIQATREDDRLRVQLRATDEGSVIQSAEYSLDGKDWEPILPSSRLFDSKELSFDFPTSPVEEGEHTVAVRVYDRFDNLAAAKAVVP